MRGSIFKFTYKQSKSEELWSAAKKGGRGSAQHRQNQRSPTQSPFCHWTPTPSHAINPSTSLFVTLIYFSPNEPQQYHITFQQHFLKTTKNTKNNPLTAWWTRTYNTGISSLDVIHSQLTETYLFYFEMASYHKDIISWSPQVSSSLLSHRPLLDPDT